MRLLDIFEATAPNLTFDETQRGFHSGGQSDRALLAYDDAEYVGHIDYAVWRGQPYVQMISVPENKRRRGYATALVRRLQREFPDTELDFGGLTDEGSKLVSTIPSDVIENPVYREASERLAHVQAELARLQRLGDEFDANPSKQRQQEILDQSEYWNGLHDQKRELEDALADLAPSKRIFR